MTRKQAQTKALELLKQANAMEAELWGQTASFAERFATSLEIDTMRVQARFLLNGYAWKSR